MSKKCTPLWREARFEVNMYKRHQVRNTFGSWDVEKVNVVVVRSKFRSQKCKKKELRVRSTFWRSDVVSRGSRTGLCILSKVSKTWGFCSMSKTMARRGHLKRICQDAFSVYKRHVMFIRAVRRSGRWFPEKGCILEPQIVRFAEMILRDRCSTSYGPVSLFRGRRSTLHRWTGKIAKCIGTRLPALHSTFHFWRKSRRIALFLMLSRSKIEEVSQNFFVFDVVKCKTLRKSRWSALKCYVLMLSSSKTKEVSKNSFVFRLADRQIDRERQLQLQLQLQVPLLLQLQVQIYDPTLQNSNMPYENKCYHI